MNFISTPRSRQIHYWQQEAETWLSTWHSCIANGNRAGAAKAKEAYIEARKTLEELEGRRNNEQD